MTADSLYSLRQAADLIDTPLSTLRRWVQEGRVPVERTGPLVLKRIRIRHSVLIELFPHAEKLSSLH